MSLAARTDEAFSRHGPLARSLPGFVPRAGQRRMARAVAEAIESREVLLVEAGTGTGKTYAYLVPVLAAGLRVVVSTGTRNLQDQLFQRDLPALAGALGRPVQVALLKGRSNYLCRHRLALTLESPPAGRRESRWLGRIRDWSLATASGEIAEVPGVPEDASVWSRVTSTAENCLGQSCPEFQRCHVVRARREALKADVVVVNHHLLLADMALKEEGFGELLPGADAVVVDEAHQLPEVASRFFGASLGTRQLRGLAADARAEAVNAGAWGRDVEAAVDGLDRAAGELAAESPAGGARVPWAELPAGVEPAMAAAEETLVRLAQVVASFEDRSAGLEAVGRRARTLSERLDLIRAGDEGFELRWMEGGRRNLSLHAAPVDAGRALALHVTERPCGWVFTSATLAVGEDFSTFLARLGLDTAETLKLDSPFDFANRTRLYLPRDLPAPSDPSHTGLVVDLVLPLLKAAGGRAFLLFTSHRALREAARRLRQQNLPYPLLVQGDEPRNRLLDRFRAAGNAVLLGTQSFWEGVDVRGPALSVVLIDKLPFAVPDDPLLKARLDSAREAGGEPFRDIQLPQAVLSLKQGVGRLIRDENDAGLAVICDPRLTSRGYGRVFLSSLPPMPVTRSGEEAVAFLESLELDVAAAG
ncbi:MAG: ATP-dependent DNA helicase [Gammaproteobacteria bacterium]